MVTLGRAHRRARLTNADLSGGGFATDETAAQNEVQRGADFGLKVIRHIAWAMPRMRLIAASFLPQRGAVARGKDGPNDARRGVRIARAHFALNVRTACQRGSPTTSPCRCWGRTRRRTHWGNCGLQGGEGGGHTPCQPRKVTDTAGPPLSTNCRKPYNGFIRVRKAIDIVRRVDGLQQPSMLNACPQGRGAAAALPFRRAFHPAGAWSAYTMANGVHRRVSHGQLQHAIGDLVRQPLPDSRTPGRLRRHSLHPDRRERARCSAAGWSMAASPAGAHSSVGACGIAPQSRVLASKSNWAPTGMMVSGAPVLIV